MKRVVMREEDQGENRRLHQQSRMEPFILEKDAEKVTDGVMQQQETKNFT